MRKRQRQLHSVSTRPRSLGRRRVVVVVVAAGLVAIAGVVGTQWFESASPNAPTAVPRNAPAATSQEPQLTDQELQRAADELLVAINPELPANGHFTEFAAERLKWMSGEHAAGRLTVAFVPDADAIGIPASVMMAATRLDGQPTIFIAKPRFATFLTEAGQTRAPFSQQLRNDFAIALVHETLHLQRWVGNPVDQEDRIREESYVWREVTLQVVRPWRSLNQPVHARFIQVDDEFRRCRDQLPCPAIGQFAKLTP